MPNLIHVECIKNMFDKESTFPSLFQAPRRRGEGTSPRLSFARLSRSLEAHAGAGGGGGSV